MTPIRSFRRVAVAEGVSFVVLLFVAMPLKYAFDLPIAVKIVGWMHGMLFLAYLALGHRAASAGGWEPGFRAWAILASLIPFGTFVLDRQLRERE